MAAMASYVPDAFLREVLQDSRVALRKIELEDAIHEEFKWLLCLPTSVWSKLGQLCKLSGQWLRAQTLHAAH
eukprot:132575-Karenia_brevis.AAC.1